MTPQLCCSLGCWKAALATPSSLAHTLEDDNLEGPPPVCTPRSEYELAFFLAAALAPVSRATT